MSPPLRKASIEQAIKSLTGIVGLALFAYVFVYFAFETSKVRTWSRAGGAQSSVRSGPDSLLVLQRVDPADFNGPVPSTGDTLLSVADSAASPARWRALMESPRQPGERVPLSYRHQGDTLATTIRLRAPSGAEVSLIIVLQALRFLIAFSFVSVALWAFFARPNSAGVRVLALFSFAMAGFVMTAVHVLGERYAGFHIPLDNIIRDALSAFASLFGAFWLHLMLQFPHPGKFMRERPVLAHLLCYLPPVLITATLVALQAIGLEDLPGVNLAFLIVVSAQVFGGFGLLVARYRRAAERLEKRQTRLVLWGTGTGLGLLFLMILLAQLFTAWFLAGQMRLLIAVNVAFLGLLFTPLSFAWAFRQYRLLEVEARLRRGTRYFLAIAAIALLVAVVGYTGGSFLQHALGGGSGWGTAVLLILAAAIVPAARVLQRMMERRYYPERQRMRAMFRDFLEQNVALTDRDAFWTDLERRLSDSLMVAGVYPLLRKEGNGQFLWRDSEHTPFAMESEFVARLERERRPIMVDELAGGVRVRLSEDETLWLAERRIAVVLPLVARSRLIGFLGLGEKIEREDYAAEELKILASLAPQVALASENIRLIDENVEKKRLEEQLQMARLIQYGFLPREIPATLGLEVAARCRFCLEVAGDYYDIIPLEDGRTVLAVGDVSGKGAGAAMIMANLQAGLRTAVELRIPLCEVVARINNLICRNTPPEQFITFFVALFDPARRELTYVNAGHNPPFLFRTDEAIDTLDVGGLILGMLPGIAYREGLVSLAPGDVLLMYTDGVSEAMNAAQEEFGEERLARLITRRRADALEAALEFVEDEVTTFCGSTDFEDDFTLLLVRVQ